MNSPFSKRMKLKDYDDAIDLYSTLERQRPLTEQERDRLYQLVQRKKQCLAGARYRAKNRDKIIASQAKWRSKNADKRRAYGAKWYSENVKHCSDKARLWRENNPDKVEANKRRQAFLRARDRFFRDVAYALGCKIRHGEFVPLSDKDRRRPLLLSAPDASTGDRVPGLGQ